MFLLLFRGLFFVSVAVLSKLIWKTTKLLFEGLLVMFFVFLLLFLVNSYGNTFYVLIVIRCFQCLAIV